MASMTLKAAATVALALSQQALGASFPINIFNRSEIEAMHLDKRGSMNAFQLWDQAEIPYILEKLPHDLSEKIRDAMRQWEGGTCIRFVPKKDQVAWVNFKKYDGGCYADQLGAPFSGETIVNLDLPNVLENIGSMGLSKKCAEKGTPGHEIGHLIGLTHEHQRPDRDQYIRISEDHIDPDGLDQFTIDFGADTSVPFDYHSIMLYDTKVYAKPKWYADLVGPWTLPDTMESLTKEAIDPWSRPTPNDFKAVNAVYGCEEYYTRMVPECRTATIPTNRDFSSYSFILDKFTEKFMTENGYTHVAAHQNCRANTVGQDTDNWGFTPVNGWGPGSPYKVTVDRCKKRFDRHPSRYEIALCKGDTERACDIKCGLRRVCPFAPAEGNNPVDAAHVDMQIDSKAVDVVDDTLWICHPL
ncbi:hypothetical protein LZ30DRAFT_609952 [Colletotrichum cereale]|nr:hypothetical protein LZ30DRAFT_609952 [Colletotrichum cereale]